MTQISGVENVKKLPVISREINCCQGFFSGEIIDILKKLNSKKQPLPEIKAQSKKEPNAFDEALSRNVDEMSRQNSLLNLRIKMLNEKHLSDIGLLKERLSLLESENEKLKKERELLKRTKKLLEDEIYRLNNNCADSFDIDNDEKN